jgi:hypothetical protein
VADEREPTQEEIRAAFEEFKRISAEGEFTLNAIYGRETRDRRRVAGKKKRGATKGEATDDDLCQAVREMHARAPSLPWSTVCARVGKRQTPPLSRRTVERRAKAADWRPAKKAGQKPTI